jgi:RHS repeat-associated protein
MKIQHFFAILFFSFCAYAATDIITAFLPEKNVQGIVQQVAARQMPGTAVIAAATHAAGKENEQPDAPPAPDEPQGPAYTPNSVKDIKMANPAEAITTIEAPTANMMGGTALTFPIKIPTGRKGMEPELALQYNSEGGHSWLGLDWNLRTAAITIETRWGVPRYSPALETETYAFNGEQLSPVTHRAEAVARTAEKQFYPRVEGGFDKIIRHGNHPSNYWWEVTDKSGTRQFYGGTPAGGADAGAVLKDDSNNIASWALTETRDLHGNFVKYRYTKVLDAGNSGGSLGSDLYPATITYTGHGTTEGKYSIEFIRDRQLGLPKRQDVSISARWGFKQVTADLLKKINVKYNGQNIRSYQLNHIQGAFYKTLLNSILEFDAAGNLFNTHGFDYYNDVQGSGTFQPLTAPEEWAPQNDNIKAGFLNPIPLFNDKASLLGGGKSSGTGFGVAVTIGLTDKKYDKKTLTVGATFGINNTKNEGMLALVDINGDGLSDKVYKKGGSLFFRPNLSGPGGTPTFGPAKPIIGITNFSQGETFAEEIGLESHYGIFGGLERSHTEDITSVYFSDVNGDQLVDIVKDGTVWFNHIDSAGNPSFTISSGDTPSPINAAASIDPALVQNNPQALETAIDDNPLHDIVKVWRAPFKGTISITQPVTLVQDTSADAQAYTFADGVRAAIQLKGIELWSANIAANDFTPKTPTEVNEVMVQKGDKIYFRVQSKFNGAYDQVVWNPEITYSSHTPALKDANALPLYQFKSDKDFLISADGAAGMAIGGQIKITGNFVKPFTSDTVTVQIRKKSGGNFTTILQQTFAGNQAVTLPVAITQDVLKNDALYFSVSANTNVDWAKLQWDPYIYFNTSTDTAVTQLFDDSGRALLYSYPLVNFKSYNKTIRPSLFWQAPASGTFAVKPQPSFSFPNFETGQLVFSIKKENQLIAKQIIPFTAGVPGTFAVDTLMLNAGDKLYFEYHTENAKLADKIINTSAVVWSDIAATVNPTCGLHTVDETFIFGPMYRHWGQFAYNGNRDRASRPIVESELKLNDNLTKPNPPSIDLSTASSAVEMQNMYDAAGGNKPKEDKFIYLVPDNRQKRWIGYDNLVFVKKDTSSASRMGKDNLLPVNPISNPAPPAAFGARGIKRISTTDNVSISVGAGSTGLSGSCGNTKSIYDFTDMNGDRYPDILSANKIQYTQANGGLEPTANNFSFGDVDKAEHFSVGFTLGGTLISSSAASFRSVSRGSKAKNEAEQSENALGISGNFNYNRDSTAFAWMDINGDGLPDRVYKDGNVQLNLGYSFLPAEPWGFAGINEGFAISYGGGLGINISNNSISAGFGLSRSENKTNRTLEDINGDGLLDCVIGDGLLDYVLSNGVLGYIFGNNPLKVAINNGSGFSPALNWAGAAAIRNNVSTGESANGAITIGIPITPKTEVAKLCINPSLNVARGANRTTVQFEDIDGDGFPDLLKSDEDSKLTVSRSTIQRTNLLKKVNRPLKGSFTIDYKRIGNTYLMPNSIWALASVELYDGVPGDGADRMRSTFQYENGRYDRNEREFYGFGKVTTLHHDTQNGDVVYRKTEAEYNNSNYYEKGLPKSETVKNAAGNKFTETLYDYVLKDIYTGATLPNSIKQSDDAAAFPALVNKQALFYEGLAVAGKTTTQTFEYDVLGNIISTTNFGDPGPADDLTKITTYHSVPATYIMDVPASVTETGSGQMYRQSATTIDANTGDITETRQYLQSGDVAKTNMEYDAYGNVIKTTRPQNATGQRLTYNYAYDSEVQTYPAKTTDSYGYSSGATYDVRFGQMLSSTDENGQKTLFTIDNVGRITTITGPLEIAAGIPFKISFEYHPEAVVPWALTKHYDPANPANFIETATFCDGLARIIQTKKDGALFTGAQTADQERMLVSGADSYDAFGRTVTQFHPTTEPKGTTGLLNTAEDSIRPTRTTFDVLDRMLTDTLPDLSVTKRQYGFGADRDGAVQFKTNTIDANGISVQSFTNVRELLKATKQQYRQGTDIWTSYDYNPVDELVQVTDDRGNRIISTYDRMGRRTSVQHPDAGLTTYKFDLNNNPIEEITANLQGSTGIKYSYDQERLLKTTYPQNPQNNVTLTYGASGAASFRAGRVVQQQDATGTQEFFYNPLGELVKNIRVINVPENPVLTYTTEWTYDTWNRLTGMQYPDGERLIYNYNFGGLLQNMSGIKSGNAYNYLAKTGYDKFEERVYAKYGNGTEMTYAFEPGRRRLKNLTTKTAAGRLVMDNTYTYDREDNILNVVNNAPVPPNNLMGGKSNYQYTYDDLYRLTGTAGTFGGSNQEHRYTLAMAYDNLSSITSKSQVHEKKANNSPNWVLQNQTSYNYTYHYNPGGQPHAAVHVGDRGYTYDANGNQTGWKQDGNAQNRQIVWDEENRAKTISDNGQLFRYTYDGEGQRVLKSNGNGQTVRINGKPAAQTGGLGNYTVYVNPYMEVRSGGFTKHFYIEEGRIVSKQGENGNSNKPEKFQSYYHTDHLGNTSFVTDRLGEVGQHLEYFPFGETFVEERSGQESTPYLYNGKELDTETGLYYYGARYYDTRTSVWPSVDPAWELPDQLDKSPYAYVVNNPITYNDPDGRAGFVSRFFSLGNTNFKGLGVNFIQTLSSRRFQHASRFGQFQRPIFDKGFVPEDRWKHIEENHLNSSNVDFKSKFKEGVTRKDIQGIIDIVLREGRARKNEGKGNPNDIIFDHDFQEHMGRTMDGHSASEVRVVVGEMNEVKTVYPRGKLNNKSSGNEEKD